MTTAMCALAAFAPPAAAAAPADQMVVFRNGFARVSDSGMGQTTVRVGRRRCALAGGTPLAVLVRSGVGPLSLRDYGACSKRPADGGGLFVSGIGQDRNRGSDGWVYKVGNVLGTAGAADPSGPFGRGRLRAGAQVTWFWCHVTARDRGCPQTLGIAQLKTSRGALSVRVRRYDDRGRGAPDVGATIHAGGKTAATGKDGVARLRLRAGSYPVWAAQAGRIRSFPVTMVVS